VAVNTTDPTLET